MVVEKVSSFLRKYRTGAIILASTAVLGGIVYVGTLFQILDPVAAWLVRTLQPWLGWLLLLSVLAIVILGVCYFQVQRKYDALQEKVHSQPNSQQGYEARLAKFKRTLNLMMGTTYRISQQTYAGRPKKRIIELANTYIIHSNGDGEVTRTYLIQSVEALHFWETKILVEQEATEQEFLEDIGFEVTDGKEEPLAYLPLENSPREKNIAVFFLPPLKPNDSQRVHVKYRWPGMFNKLIDSGYERAEWDLSPQTVDSIPKMEFSFFVDPKIGKQLQISEEGSRGGSQKKIPAVNKHYAFSGTTYVVENGPPEKYAVGLILK